MFENALRKLKEMIAYGGQDAAEMKLTLIEVIIDLTNAAIRRDVFLDPIPQGNNHCILVPLASQTYPHRIFYINGMYCSSNIWAIKKIRAAHNCGLKEAKDYVDALPTRNADEGNNA